jgi:hypothetical protein
VLFRRQEGNPRVPWVVCILLACSLAACQGKAEETRSRVMARNPVVAPVPSAASPEPLMGDTLPATPVPSGYLEALPAGVVLPPLAPLPPRDVSLPPAPVLSPPAVTKTQILSNTLLSGIGIVSGSVVQQLDGRLVGVPGASVRIVAVQDNTRIASMLSGDQGGFYLANVALGNYYVQVEKSGYISDTQPSVLRLYPGYTAAHSSFILVAAAR